jgi:hypothetical protein
MNFTSQQKDLLFAIVDAHLSGDGAPFIFVQSHSGRGLCYPRGRSIPISADEVDFRQLAQERLITSVRVSGPGLRGNAKGLTADNWFDHSYDWLRARGSHRNSCTIDRGQEAITAILDQTCGGIYDGVLAGHSRLWCSSEEGQSFPLATSLCGCCGNILRRGEWPCGPE